MGHLRCKTTSCSGQTPEKELILFARAPVSQDSTRYSAAYFLALIAAYLRVFDTWPIPVQFVVDKMTQGQAVSQVPPL
jgi:hypothetical protein